MIPFPINFIGFIGLYFVMMMLYNAIHQTSTHSIGIRILAILLSYTLLLFFLTMFFQFFYLFYLMFTESMAVLALFFLSLFGIILYRIYNLNPEKYMVREMMNFIWVSLTFGNYFRLRDVDTQEQIGTHKMKRIYEEVHGKPFKVEVLVTSFDEQVTKFKKVSIEELKQKKRVYPPEYFDEVERLNDKQTTDVSVSFRFQLLNNTLHSLMKRMQHFEIDPVARVLALDIVYPVEKMIPLQLQAEQTRLAEKVYESLQILIAEEWFSLYEPFVSIITVTCRQKEFNDSMAETIRSVMTFKMSLHQLHQRSNRITTGSELMKIAEVKFL